LKPSSDVITVSPLQCLLPRHQVCSDFVLGRRRYEGTRKDESWGGAPPRTCQARPMGQRPCIKTGKHTSPSGLPSTTVVTSSGLVPRQACCQGLLGPTTFCSQSSPRLQPCRKSETETTRRPDSKQSAGGRSSHPNPDLVSRRTPLPNCLSVTTFPGRFPRTGNGSPTFSSPFPAIIDCPHWGPFIAHRQGWLMRSAAWIKRWRR